MMAGKTRQTQDAALVLALARGERQEDAARHAGLSPRTVSRKLSDATFASRVQEARCQLIGEVKGALVGGTLEALKVLQALLGAESETVRLGAAKALLDNFARFQTIEGLAERVTQLEAGRPFFRYTTEQLKEMRRRALAERIKEMDNGNGSQAQWYQSCHEGPSGTAPMPS